MSIGYRFASISNQYRIAFLPQKAQKLGTETHKMYPVKCSYKDICLRQIARTKKESGTSSVINTGWS